MRGWNIIILERLFIKPKYFKNKIGDGKQMKVKKIHGSKDRDLEGIKEIAEGFLDINIDDLSAIQKKCYMSII